MKREVGWPHMTTIEKKIGIQMFDNRGSSLKTFLGFNQPQKG
jgi:hypothetical protein